MSMLFQFKRHLLALPRMVKRVVVITVDVCLCTMSVWIAFYLRIGEFRSFGTPAVIALVVSIFIAIPIFLKAGLYRAIFRYNGLPALISIGRALLLYLMFYSMVFTFGGISGVPRTIGLIQPILLVLFVGLTRAAARLLLGGVYNQNLHNASKSQALIYGAGNAGCQLALALASSPSIHVVGFIDDDDRLHGNLLNGLPIFSPTAFPHVVKTLKITDVLLALPAVSRQRRNEIIDCLKSSKVVVRTLPDLSDLATGVIGVNHIRDLDIDDLLGRDPVKPDALLLNDNICGKVVLVTGAGGSIGGEICRQIIKVRPKKILLVELSEFALYQIHQELLIFLQGYCEETERADKVFNDKNASLVEAKGSDFHRVEVVPLLASVCDERRIGLIIETWKPHIVYHAAAYKHVPLVEHNPTEGIINNIWGTRICAEAALRYNVERFILISTDKAVRPTNIMGATKRLAEMVLQGLASKIASNEEGKCVAPYAKTIFSIVRFGNVLGSSGSVVPLFRDQIRNGGPLTLTHPDITRYFMTIPEAAQLVIQAGAMGHGGEVFVLDMGNPVRILDLANRMVELSGLRVRDEFKPDGDIEIIVTGLRPGEKLYEELLIGDNPEPTQHPRILKARESCLGWFELDQKLSVLWSLIMVNDIDGVRSFLRQTVNGYNPTGEVVDWVYMSRGKASGIILK